MKKKFLFFIFLLFSSRALKCAETLLQRATESSQIFFTPSIFKTLQQSPAFTTKKPVSFNPSGAPDRPLLNCYPVMAKNLPWIKLANLPTPIIHLTTLGKSYNALQVYMKDDGKTTPSVGGNKVRKLELLLAEALFLGANHIMTFGCAGSNHATATAFHAHQLGLNCSLFLTDQPLSAVVKNNLLIDKASQAHIFYYPSPEIRKLGALHHFVQLTYQEKKFPYVIGIGGSSALGAIGYVNAVFELKEQIAQGSMPEPDFIYCPAGSLGTIAGLTVGIRATGLNTKIIAVAIEPNTTQITSFIRLANSTNDLLHTLDPSFPLFIFTSDQITCNIEFQGPAYGVITPEAHAALTIFKEQEEINLETTYSAKAAAALLQDLATKPELRTKTILFWNTFGIEQQTFPEDAYTHLPKPFHTYFEN